MKTIEAKAAKPPTQTRNPAASREKILSAAVREFAEKGLDGARVEKIARRSRVNKNLLYHYFGDKDQLFLAVLEHVYQTLRDHQSDLSIRGMEPEDGMRKLVEFTANVWIEMPDFLRILSSENLHEARHVRQSRKISGMYNPLLDTINELLHQGVKKGAFRSGVDPIDLYISISSLSAHYVANRHTFEAIFQTSLMTPKRLRTRLAHITDMVLRYVRHD